MLSWNTIGWVCNIIVVGCVAGGVGGGEPHRPFVSVAAEGVGDIPRLTDPRGRVTFTKKKAVSHSEKKTSQSLPPGGGEGRSLQGLM